MTPRKGLPIHAGNWIVDVKRYLVQIYGTTEAAAELARGKPEILLALADIRTFVAQSETAITHAEHGDRYIERRNGHESAETIENHRPAGRDPRRIRGRSGNDPDD